MKPTIFSVFELVYHTTGFKVFDILLDKTATILNKCFVMDDNSNQTLKNSNKTNSMEWKDMWISTQFKFHLYLQQTVKFLP